MIGETDYWELELGLFWRLLLRVFLDNYRNHRILGSGPLAPELFQTRSQSKLIFKSTVDWYPSIAFTVDGVRIEEAAEVLAVAVFLPRVTSGCGFIGFMCPHRLRQIAIS